MLSSARNHPPQPSPRRSNHRYVDPEPPGRRGYGDSNDEDIPATRYFVIRAPKDALERSLQSGVWATQRVNEGRLVSAFHQTRVALLFCPVHSNQFQGLLPSFLHNTPCQE